MSSSNLIVLITGVGYETAANPLSHTTPCGGTYHILLGSRSLPSGQTACETHLALPGIKGIATRIHLDVTSDASVDGAAAHVKETYGPLDVLVNHAGVFPKNPVKRDALLEVLETNCVGCTEGFLPLLLTSATTATNNTKLIFVSSSVGSLSQALDPTSRYHSPGGAEYRASKACLNMFVVQYHVRLSSRGIRIFGADPGLCVTDFLDKESVRKRG